MGMQYVFDGQGRRVGYYNDMGSTVYAHGKNGQNVGFYNRNANTTYDKTGKRYGVGDMTTALIMDAAKNSR